MVKETNTNTETNKDKNDYVPILLSSHLAGENAQALSEFEYGLVMVNNAFQRWMQSCSTACEQHNLSTLDNLVIHNIYHRDRAKRITDVTFTLNLDDSHNVSYSVRKLVKSNMLQHEKRGKETYYSVTPSGKKYCLEYAKIREKCLIQALDHLSVDSSLSEVAKLLRTLSGVYAQASRAASSL
ncbi:winged helix DNA-binding protein [Psychromonas sp. SP041]|uniref:winged helix DNA-binding protein n=1 Tax=Psychromonas sp. SP041 TaxID=1365007 RepID=UPI00040C6FD9|nr:winged helix DNA-binding protein [Psychromonas sp. SP041]